MSEDKKYIVEFCINDLDYVCPVKAKTKQKAKYAAFLIWKREHEDAEFREFIYHANAIERT